MSFDERLLTALDALKDWPRSCHYCAFYGQGNRLRPYLAAHGGDPLDPASLHSLTHRGSVNQGLGYLAAAYELHPALYRAEVIRRLDDQAVNGHFAGEFGATNYRSINPGWALSLVASAQRHRDAEVYGRAVRVLAMEVAYSTLLECPATAHRQLRGRRVSPGGRSGDLAGMQEQGDHIVWLLRDRRGLPDDRFPGPETEAVGAYVEIFMALDAVLHSIVPPLAGDGPLPRPRWPLEVWLYQHGHRARFGDLTDTIAPLWEVEVDYRRPKGEIRHVAWDDLVPDWGRGEKFPGRRAPRRLEPRSLGELRRHLVLDRSLPVPDWRAWRLAGGGGRPVPPSRPKPPTPPPGKPSPGPVTEGTWSALGDRLLLRRSSSGGSRALIVVGPLGDDPFAALDLRETVAPSRVHRVRLDRPSAGDSLVVAGAGAGVRRWLLDVAVVGERRNAQLVVETQGDRSPLYYIREHRR